MKAYKMIRAGYARFFMGLGIGCAGLLVIWTILFYAQLGRPTPEGQRRCALMQAKTGIATLMRSPKMILVGGSGVHQGLSADMISEAIDRPVVNFGSFAELSADQMLFNTRRIARKGDVVVLAFEYKFYTGRRQSAVAVDFTLSCGTDYFRAMPPLARLQTIVGTPVERLWSAFRYHPDDGVADIVRRRISANGDRMRDRAVFPAKTAEMSERNALYRPMYITVDENGPDARKIKSFVLWARAQGVCVLASWPNTIYFRSYEDDPGLARIVRFYHGLGVEVVGRPTDMMLPASEFYDTQYHLDIPGIEKRTTKFIRALRSTYKCSHGRAANGSRWNA